MATVARVDVITVNFHSEDVLLGLVASLRELASRRPGLRLMVVDCGGLAEGGPDLGAAPELPVNVLDAGGNIGFGAAVNLGLDAAEAEVVLIVNPDLRLDPEAADRLLEAGASSEAVAWTGVLRNDDGTIQRNTAPPPALRRQLAEYLLSADTRLAPTDELRRVGVITGALLCARTQTMRAVGGFDARYPLYMEDVELSVRLGELGPLVQFPIEVGVHTGGVSASRSERPGDLDVLLHASRVAWLRERSAAGAAVLRSAVMAGSALRRIVGRGPRLNLRLLWRATARGFDLRTLLPGATVRT